MYLPNRLELLLRAVLALPKASSRGFSCERYERKSRKGEGKRRRKRWEREWIWREEGGRKGKLVWKGEWREKRKWNMREGLCGHGKGWREGGEDGNMGEGTTHKKEIPLSDNHILSHQHNLVSAKKEVILQVLYHTLVPFPNHRSLWSAVREWDHSSMHHCWQVCLWVNCLPSHEGVQNQERNYFTCQDIVSIVHNNVLLHV